MQIIFDTVQLGWRLDSPFIFTRFRGNINLLNCMFQNILARWPVGLFSLNFVTPTNFFLQLNLVTFITFILSKYRHFFLQYFRPYPEGRFLRSVLKCCSMNCLLPQSTNYLLAPLLFSLCIYSLTMHFFLCSLLLFLINTNYNTSSGDENGYRKCIFYNSPVFA